MACQKVCKQGRDDIIIGVGTGGKGGAPGACAPPKFHKLLYKLLTTLCVVSDCAPPPPPQSKSLSYAPDNSEGKSTKPHPCIVFTLVCNCNVRRCRDRAL